MIVYEDTGGVNLVWN